MKCKKSFLLLLAVVSIFTACGKTTSDSAQEPVGQEVSNNPSSKSIQLLSSDMLYGSGNREGYYYAARTENGDTLIHYIDYTADSDIVLCNQPNCSHNGEECAAWFAYCGAPLNLFVDEQSIYILNGGATFDKFTLEHFGKSALPKIEKCNLDGSNRQFVISFQANEAISSMPASDGQNLYFFVTSYSENQSETRLITLDANNGNVVSENAFSQGAPGIIGAYDRMLVIDSPADNFSGNSIFTYNVDTQEIKERYQGERGTCVCRQDTCYILDGTTGKISRISLQSGEETILETDLITKGLMFCSLENVTDKGFVVAGYLEGESSKINMLVELDGSSHVQTIKAQAADEYDKQLNLQIFAQKDNELLVAPIRLNSVMTIPIGENELGDIEELCYRFGWITTEDFWSDQPNYRMIDNAA